MEFRNTAIRTKYEFTANSVSWNSHEFMWTGPDLEGVRGLQLPLFQEAWFNNFI